MLTVIKGTYDNGQIIWDEIPPVQKRTKVVVTFLEQDTEAPPENDHKRRGGSMKGEVWMADDFNDTLSTNQSETDKKGIRLGSWQREYSLPDDFNDPLDGLNKHM